MKEIKDRPFLLRVALAVNDHGYGGINVLGSYRYLKRQGASNLEQPHDVQEMRINVPLEYHESTDTTQPHGSLRTMIRQIIEGGRER